MPEDKPRTGLVFQVGDVDRNLASLEQKLGHVFSDPRLLLEALTHSTYAYEHRYAALANNERLEFLGDAVLDLVVSDCLFRIKPELSEGRMTKSRALVVCENALVGVAQELMLGDFLSLGRGELATGGRLKPSNLANAMEAVFGAIYLDAGYMACRSVISRLFAEPIALALRGELFYDYKSRVLEMVQATRGGSTLRFQILEESGPVHERTFVAGVFLDDQLIARGSGCSKKEAEQQAAEEAINRMSCSRDGCAIIESEDGAS